MTKGTFLTALPHSSLPKSVIFTYFILSSPLMSSFPSLSPFYYYYYFWASSCFVELIFLIQSKLCQKFMQPITSMVLIRMFFKYNVMTRFPTTKNIFFLKSQYILDHKASFAGYINSDISYLVFSIFGYIYDTLQKLAKLVILFKHISMMFGISFMLWPC